MNQNLGSKPADGTVTGQPFDTKVSANHRIPGLVFHNGMLTASADVRWDDEKDGGGLDVVVSRSADGKVWNYTYPGYLGDNGNVWNACSSTLMDPVIISDGKKLYLLADLFPAGYSIGTWSTAYTFSDTGPAFNEDGCLLLSGDGLASYGYYLKDGKIFTADGVEIGYTVKGWYDLYNEKGEYVSNLYFADSPYLTRPTSFICMTESADDGKTWSDPVLLDLKDEGTKWLVLGPGSGLVDREGELVFTCYDGSNIYLIHGRDNCWKKVKTNAASGESSVILLNDGTVRAMVRRAGDNTIAYVDFTKMDGTYVAGKLVDTGDANFSQCMVSSLHYSRTYQGREVILVCCPSDATKGDWAGRDSGKIYAYALDEGNDMTLIGTHQLNSGFFAYSDMEELPDGTVGVLYEDDCIQFPALGHYGTASHITYVNVDLEKALGITFD